MIHVRQILDKKGTEVWSVSSDDTVFKALELMAEKGVGALLVVDDGNLVGIMSERDYARKVILMGKSSKDAPVKDIMTSDVLIISPEQTIENCMALMSEKRIRHLPVVDKGKLVGLVSIGDVVKSIIAEKEFIINQLENYIHGR